MGYLIFGGSGGIGSAVTAKLRERGLKVVVAARGQRGAVDLHCDVTDPAQVDAAVANVAQLDGMVHCVGSIVLKAAHQTSLAEWDSTIALNLTSAFSAVRASAKAMMNGGGSIVLMSSAAGRVGLMNHDAIAAAKAGVIGLTMSAAATYARYGIRVNCVAPGLVRTPLSAKITGNEASLKASEAMHPLGRIGEPEEVAEAIVMALESKWMTGQVLGIDGGLATVRGR
jgi:3-oxoacyl-[acyl-carrier protein] reductase